jgi:hypothetical protein
MKLKTIKAFSTILTIALCLTGCELHFTDGSSAPSMREVSVGDDGEYITIASPNLSTWRSESADMSLQTTMNGTDQFIGKIYNTHAYFNVDRFTLQHVNDLNSLMPLPGLNVNSFAAGIAGDLQIFSNNDTSPYNLASVAPGLTSYYNTTQLTIMNNYFTEVANATSQIYVTKAFYRAEDAAYLNPNLSNEQVVAVMGIIEYANEFAKKHFAGYSSAVMVDIINETDLPAATAPCQINWRNIWRGAVLGGAVGGVRGAYVGATGGSVAFPGLGTMGGALGGAVFGFAAGFAGGAGIALLEQGFFGCLLKSPSLTPPTACNDLNFALANPEYCQIDAPFGNLRWYLLNN